MICFTGDHTLSVTVLGESLVDRHMPTPHVVIRCEPNGRRIGDVRTEFDAILSGTVALPTPGPGTPPPDFIWAR